MCLQCIAYWESCNIYSMEELVASLNFQFQRFLRGNKIPSRRRKGLSAFNAQQGHCKSIRIHPYDESLAGLHNRSPLISKPIAYQRRTSIGLFVVSSPKSHKFSKRKRLSAKLLQSRAISIPKVQHMPTHHRRNKTREEDTLVGWWCLN